MLDAEGNVLYVSQSVRRMMGYAPEELVDTSAFDHIHPDDVARVREAFATLLRSPGTPMLAEYRMRHKDGGWRVLESTAMNRLRELAVGAVVVNQRDITPRRQAEDELGRTNEALRALFQASPLATVELSLDGRILRRNPAAETMFGYTDEEVVGQPIPARSEEERRKLLNLLAQVGGGSLIEGFEMPFQRKDGRWIDIRVFMAPLRDAARRICGAVCLMGDVTEAKRTEQALRESEERYRLLFKRNLAGVFRTSADGRFLDANDSLARMLGYESGEELLGRDMVEYCSGPAEREHLVREMDARGQVVSYELEVRRVDGSAGCLLMNSTLLRDQQGAIVGREGTLLDITERRALQQQLLHSQKMDAVGQLAGGVAHDFNNLLMVISSYAELLSSTVSDNLKAKQQAEEILKAGRRAAGLTRQLLAFSRKQVMSPRMLDLNSVLTEMEPMLNRLIGENIQVMMIPGTSLVEGKGRSGADRAGDHEPGGERARCHATGREAAAGDIERRTGRGIYPAALGGTGGGVRAADGKRHRMRHSTGNPAAHFRAVLHHERAGERNRAGAAHRLRDRETERGICMGVQRGGARNGVQGVPAARR